MTHVSTPLFKALNGPESHKFIADPKAVVLSAYLHSHYGVEVFIGQRGTYTEEFDNGSVTKGFTVIGHTHYVKVRFDQGRVAHFHPHDRGMSLGKITESDAIMYGILDSISEPLRRFGIDTKVSATEASIGIEARQGYVTYGYQYCRAVLVQMTYDTARIDHERESLQARIVLELLRQVNS